MRRARFLLTVLLLATLCATLASAAQAGEVYAPTEYTYATWARTDLAVAEGLAARTWMWGPAQLPFSLFEPYLQAPDDERFVQYYDKARMEITNPFGDTSSVWYVTTACWSSS